MKESLRVIKYFVIFLLTIFFFLPAAVYGQNSGSDENPGTIQVVGTSAIAKKNIPGAKQAAITNGLLTAVDQAAVSIIPAEAIAATFQQYNNFVIPKPDNFIDNYKVLAESISGGKYRVLMEVKVSIEKLKQSLTEFSVNAKNSGTSGPKILFLIAEQNLDDIFPKFWWSGKSKASESFAESTMARMLEEAGFSVIDHGAEVPHITVEAAIILEPDLDNRDAVDIGKYMGADIVIVGKAIVYKVPDTEEDIPSFNATITARAIVCKTGEVLISILETSVEKEADEALGAQKALISAARLAGEKIKAQISFLADKAGSGANSIELIVSGTSNIGNFVRFRIFLRKMPGIDDMKIEEIRQNQSVIKVRYKGSSEELANALENSKERLVSFYIKNAGDNKIEIGLGTN